MLPPSPKAPNPIYRSVLCLAVCLGMLQAVGTEEVISSHDVVYQVQIHTPEDVARLEAAGLSVDRITEDGAIVYVPPGKYDALAALKLPYTPLPPPRDTKAPPGYRDYNAITADLAGYAAAYPELTHLISLGQSVQGRELWALRLSAAGDAEAAKPAVKYVATMHGDEPLGTELCLYFIDWLLTDYGSDPRITRLLDETHVWIVPLMNPDGYQIHSRFNANGSDLNRSFPHYGEDFTDDWYDDEAGIDWEAYPTEVQHVMAWTLDNGFVLSANMHTGELVANYPYDAGVDIPSGMPAPTPDEQLFRRLARRYADLHPAMRERTSPLLGFEEGIVNGSRWYRITGSMQDWHYRYLGSKEITLELSMIKSPSADQLPTHWDYNAEAMLHYLEGVYQAVAGAVYDRHTGEAVWARVRVAGNERAVYSHPESGYFHRLLDEGIHDLVVEAPGYIPYRLTAVEVETDQRSYYEIPLSDGDVNGDGSVDAVDIQLIVNAILGYDISYDADVDGGGGVSATDLQAVINIVLGYDTTQPIP